MDKQELIDRLRAKAKENGQKTAQYSDYTDKTYFTGIQRGYDRSAKLVDQLDVHEKVVLAKEQAEIVEKARLSDIPATYISGQTDAYSGEESLLMNAYVNGFTVAKDKKYVVYKELGGKQDKDNHVGYVQACRSCDYPETMLWFLADWIINDQSTRLTEKEITDFGLQDCEKKEVTDNDEED